MHCYTVLLFRSRYYSHRVLFRPTLRYVSIRGCSCRITHVTLLIGIPLLFVRPLYQLNPEQDITHKRFADAAEQHGGFLGDCESVLVDRQQECGVHIGVGTDRPRRDLATTDDGLKYRHPAGLKSKNFRVGNVLLALRLADTLHCANDSEECCTALHNSSRLGP